MIIGGSKKEVIENIKTNILNNELNKKVETTDPTVSEEESRKLIDNYYKLRKNKLKYLITSFYYNKFIDGFNKKVNKGLEIEGYENLKDIKTGAIITSNHFNPLDSLAIRQMVKKAFHKRYYIVSQETNLALPGILGKIVNNQNVIPLCKSTNYIIKEFTPRIKEILSKNNYVLIYPEEEMWFNYRKPRPCKRGAYQFAAEAGVPIISCFTEIIDLDKEDNDEFNEVKYKLHILKPIYPDPEKSVRTNSIEMAEKDYKQKIEIYEKVYNKKLDYTFDISDIAGYKKQDK